LIRCSAFCLTLSERAERKAAEASLSIDRISSGVRKLERYGTGTQDENAVVSVLALDDGNSLPVVHGFQPDLEDSGEFSRVVDSGGRLLVARDPAGTRPLYIGDSGDWFSSDHRFLRDERFSLLPSGAEMDVQRRHSVQSASVVQPALRLNFDVCAAELAQLIDSSVRERVKGRKRVAVSFSGGLDSSIIAYCASKYADVIGCSVYSARAFDEQNAPSAAELLDMELACEKVNAEAVKRELSALDLPFQPTPMDKSLWCIYSIAARSAAGLGADVILLGQLADELFGGYMKYQRAAEAQGPETAKRMMERDILEAGRRGFIRDEIACCRSIEPRFPFADARILQLGLSTPVDFKIRSGTRKALLREAAKVLGLPEELAIGPKKAAQYSSGLLKLVG
jgi:asparagine synthase (glutamine-hydrolysing)